MNNEISRVEHAKALSWMAMDSTRSLEFNERGIRGSLLYQPTACLFGYTMESSEQSASTIRRPRRYFLLLHDKDYETPGFENGRFSQQYRVPASCRLYAVIM
jgi:hypothetical protein